MTAEERRTAIGGVIAIFAASLLVGLTVYVRVSSEVLGKERELFSVVRGMRRAPVSLYLETMIQETRFWAQNRIMREALIQLSGTWREQGDAGAARLHRLYVDENPYPAGERDNLERAADDSSYSAVHQRYHYWLRSFVLHRGVHDVALCDAEGNVVYTSLKESDFGTNLLDGPYSGSDVSRAFLEARANPYPSYVAVYDFAAYEPSGGAPAMFIASPVLADNGRFLGLVAFQIAPDGINRIVREVGLRQTGKTFLLGPDLTLRSRTRFSETETMLETQVDTETAQLALEGEEGQKIALDYRGVPVLSTYGPLRVDRLRWAILAEIDEAEYLAPAHAIRTLAIASSLGFAALGSLAFWLWARRVSGASRAD